MKRSTIFVQDIIELIIDRSYYDVTKFSYDYDSKRIRYDNEEFEPKLESIQFKIAFQYNFHWKEYQDAIYYFARMNTPKPDAENDILTEPIQEWLEENEKTETSIIEIIKNVFSSKPVTLTNRALEMRVSKCLKELGWHKVKKSYGNVWIKDCG